jgi:putative FmdB family regulatory protein
MPIYEYVCLNCDTEFEELVFSQDEPVACPSCRSENTEKLMSACRAQVKGGPNLEALQGSGCGSGKG